MAVDTSVSFTGIKFENPFLLSSAPPTESESNIMRAFDAGWGGVVSKTIGLHPVVNVYGAKAKFMRTSADSAHVSMKKRDGAALHSSWNWELISDKPIDWWEPRIRRIKDAHPGKVLIASIMAGSGNDKELGNWQLLAQRCQEAGADGLELNFSCPHMDRKDMGSNIGKDKVLCSSVTEAVKEVAKVPVWCKLTPATANIVEEAGACFLGGADAIVSSNTFPSLPLIDAETLEFEINVDGFVSSGGLGGPAILPMALAKMAQLTQAFPDRSFSGIGGISDMAQAASYFAALGFTLAGTQCYRQIIDLGDLAHGRWVVPLGASGHPGHKHYTDQVEPWSKNEHVPMLYDWGEIEKDAEGTIVLGTSAKGL